MIASELIKVLTNLIEKHGDLPVFVDDQEYEAWEVEAVKYLNRPFGVNRWSSEEIPELECILLQDEEYATPDLIVVCSSEEAPPFSFKYDEKIDGQLDIVAFTPEGIQISTPKGHVVTIPNDSPSTVFGIRDDDEGATVIPH